VKANVCAASVFFVFLWWFDLERSANHRDAKNTEKAQRSKAATNTAKGFDLIIGSILHPGGVKYL